MKYIFAFAFTLFLAAPALAGDWANWRGPEFNGSTDETNLPSQWSRTENIAWSADLPGPSAATPIVWGDYVFVSSADEENDTLLAMAFDRSSGKLRWQHEVGTGISKDYRSTYASPSPATDGETVVFFYGNGDLFAYDLDGKQKWHKNLGPFAFGWTFSTSPVLHQGKLYMQILQRDVQVAGEGRPDKNESFLLALDPETGEQLWRVLRPGEARAESLEAFTTPTPYEHEGREELLVAGGDVLTGHDLETGKELWRWGTWNPTRIPHWRLVPSPVASEEVVLVCAPKGDPVYAIRAGGNGRLDDEEAVVWTSEETKRQVTSDVSTPAYYQGDFFILKGKPGNGALSRVEPQTGRVKWSIDTPGRAKYEASPLAADGKIYVMNFDGEVAVVDADSGEIQRVIPMEKELREDRIRASIIAAHGNLFIRTSSKLWCVGQ